MRRTAQCLIVVSALGIALAFVAAAVGAPAWLGIVAGLMIGPGAVAVLMLSAQP